jgi:hypothetical protein
LIILNKWEPCYKHLRILSIEIAQSDPQEQPKKQGMSE